MNCTTVRELLAMIRPDSRDADLPEGASAQTHLEQCAECQAYFENQQRVDRELGQALRKVEVPVDLKARLLAQLAVAVTTSPKSASAATAAAESSPPPIIQPRPTARSWNRRQLTKVVTAALLVVGLVGSGWFLFARHKPTLTIEQIEELAHQPGIARPSAIPASFRPELPLREIRMPQDIQTVYGLRHEQVEIGAAIPFRVPGSGRSTLSVVLVVIDLRRVDVPAVNSLGTSFLAAGVSYPKPNSYATRVWRVGQNLYVCYVISKQPQDLDSLSNQPATT